MAAQICETCKKKGCRCYCPPNSTCGAYEPREITWFEKIKMMDIDEFAEWLDEHDMFDNSPWTQWFDEQYCQNCESVVTFVPYLNGEHECAWCEVNGKCRYFQEIKDVPDGKEIIKMWLESKVI